MNRICLGLLLCTSLQAYAQDEPYYGGNGDGSAYSDLMLYTMATPAQYYAYYSGNGDGHAYGGNLNYNLTDPPPYFAFYGGNGDGNTNQDVIQYGHTDPPQYFAFYGGDGDGNSRQDIIPYHHVDPPQFYAFFGGAGDGYSTQDIIPYNHADPPQFYAFFGGDGDGFAGDLLPMYIPPILPVRLLSFEGKISGANSLLEWKVSDEDDIIRYELERSGNGKNYQRIYTREVTDPAHTKKEYSYTDMQPLDGANYYRLKCTDHEEQPEYSTVVLLYFKNDQQSLVIYPNPATQTLMVQYKSNTDAQLSIVDTKGSLIMQQSLKAGAQTIPVPLAQLTQGMYMLHISSDGGLNRSMRFVKQ